MNLGPGQAQAFRSMGSGRADHIFGAESGWLAGFPAAVPQAIPSEPALHRRNRIFFLPVLRPCEVGPAMSQSGGG